MPETCAIESALPGPRIGIIGGGQLAKMTGLAALQLGCELAVLERSSASPALKLASHRMIGDWDDPRVLLQFAQSVDLLTLENEFVSPRGLEALEAAGHCVFPGSRTLHLVQDKLVQKTTFLRAGLPVPRFRSVESLNDLLDTSREYGWPLVLKARRFGYDGKGNATLRSFAEARSGWESLGARDLFVEEFCPFVAELAVIITRGRQGEIAAYPVVQSIQQDHICREVHAPADIDAATTARALAIAAQAVTSVHGIGTFGVELFLLASGELVINEIAPRVHNSGHYTVEACECSQFENHVRAILGWPLGSTRLLHPAVMVNILAAGRGSGQPRGLDAALKYPGIHVHLYGKAVAVPGRKMGHVTALAASCSAAAAQARAAAAEISFGDSL